MTLFKAINAAREVLSRHKGKANPYQERFDEALATLPDKPMTEDELLLIVKKHVKGMANPETVRATIQALKAANVLYVEED